MTHQEAVLIANKMSGIGCPTKEQKKRMEEADKIARITPSLVLGYSGKKDVRLSESG